MPAKRIIPCLDVKQGRVVKGVQFKDLRDLGNPVQLARRYDAEGADELVFLDIAASIENRGTREAWVREVAHELSIPFTVGGGVSHVEDARSLLRAGADKVAVNTAAALRPALVRELAEAFGRQCVVAAVDVKRDAALGWRVYLKGGTEPTERSAQDWLWELSELGAGEILLTSMDRDGTGEGFDIPLLDLASKLPIPLIASGGAGREIHFLEALEHGADAVLAATLFHEGILSISQLKAYLAHNDLSVRI
ncbi:imidazole glycerol phosphate synthase subunit HisF [Geothrix sp. PMB-07]|uniref:imidazole glycerol phosphate synthase subunit HisF n=1 Tax=Geothrix sp. PMB-07 TaxID=3068640 RepID=UPI002741E574|nr:imidazole glycerol phosphate synthase subunit HisF [Geothrix sp. PMB-07]WLT30100.1 imidazole glycerol phosphate synthase subunit HisF [Geothrix sp. PMB-07]